MNELIEQHQHVFKKRLPRGIADVFSIKAVGDQIIVTIGPAIHIFVGSHFKGLIQASEFLDTLKRVHEEIELLQFKKVFPKYLGFLESLTA